MRALFVAFRAVFTSRATLVAENLALRQQLAVLSASGKRPKLRPRDRVFWVWLCRVWRDWRSCLVLVQPAAAIRRRHVSLYPTPISTNSRSSDLFWRATARRWRLALSS